ncbi:hypothetical protein CRG98_034079 [Punica granatum]|nr:hypothetical protein CRG98_034079 [Punica granatum]
MGRASGVDEDPASLNLRETELRLGLPGSQSHDRSKPTLAGVSIFGKDLEFSLSPSKNSAAPVSGAKRGFSDAINGGKGVGGLFSPRSGESSVNAHQSAASNSKPLSKEGFGASPQTKTLQEKKSQAEAPATKAQVVGWPPIRSFRKNTMATNLAKNNDDTETKSEHGCLYIKVSLDGAPYLRKVDLKTYSNYAELSRALEKMFSCFTIGQCAANGLSGQDGLTENCLKDILHGSEYVLTYEDKDGDWMLVGDVPWEMFTDSCRRLRIMKSSEAIGLAPRAMEKCKSRD